MLPPPTLPAHIGPVVRAPSAAEFNRGRLLGHGLRRHAAAMFAVTEAEAAAIRAAFDRGGELSATVELRRLFPGIANNVQARACARTIAGWTKQTQ